jgi:endo-1,4-beta-xylanase
MSLASRLSSKGRHDEPRRGALRASGLLVGLGLFAAACAGTGEHAPAPADAAGAGGEVVASGGSGGTAVETGDGGGGDVDAAGDGPAPVDPTVIKTAAAQTGRLFGAALGAGHLSEATYAATAAAELSWVTPENEMKWSFTEPSPNSFTYSAGDAIVSFAQQNGMSVKGHTLVWHSQLPAWVSAITDANQLRAALINHVFQEALHYSGQVVAWDVVNEAVADSGTSLRSSIFYQLLGASYIDDAFNTAHAADPNARLYYNDYGAEGLGAKSDYVYHLVQGMLARGVPIHGVGLQMHTGTADTPSTVDIAANMQRLAALGLEVAITEMDVPTCADDLDAQSARFHDIVAACVAQPACKAITVWGLTDKYSWLNGTGCDLPRPLLFDDTYIAKPAHAGVLNAFLGH